MRAVIGFKGALTEYTQTGMGDARSSLFLGKRALPIDRVPIYRLMICLVPRGY
jgi:hypothetical protein